MFDDDTNIEESFNTVPQLQFLSFQERRVFRMGYVKAIQHIAYHAAMLHDAGTFSSENLAAQVNKMLDQARAHDDKDQDEGFDPHCN